MKKINLIWLFFLLFIPNAIYSQSPVVPGKYWEKYESPEEAGFSSQKLEGVKDLFKESGGISLMAIYDGRILLDIGPTHRRFRQASIRKSYLSALIGRYEGKSGLNLESTLANIGIDDQGRLTEEEKQARLVDLMKTSSGIYLPSAYAPKSMIENLPARGSFKPGSHWHYNNWDFNAVGSIFNKLTGKDLFLQFKEELADPLGMEEFRLFDTFYRLEEDKSEHPAYLFKMSARDMARFGLLFLREGKWKGKQIIPSDWIKRSTTTQCRELEPRFQGRGSYGLMWWVAEDIDGQRAYYASGSGGQRIYVLPEANLVFVHLTDTYQEKNVRHAKIEEMVRLLLEAKVAKPKADPKFAKYRIQPQKIDQVKLSKEDLDQFAGSYQHPALGAFTIQSEKNWLVLKVGIGSFHLFPVGPNTFHVEDMDQRVEFQPGSAEQKGKVIAQLDEQRNVEKVIFYY